MASRAVSWSRRPWSTVVGVFVVIVADAKTTVRLLEYLEEQNLTRPLVPFQVVDPLAAPLKGQCLLEMGQLEEDVENSNLTDNNAAGIPVIKFPWYLKVNSFKFPTIAAVHLNMNNFQQTVIAVQEDILIIEFYADWCPHCQHFAPDFERFASACKKHNVAAPPGKKIFVGSVDCVRSQPLCARFAVQGFPTMYLAPKAAWTALLQGPEPMSLADKRKGLTEVIITPRSGDALVKFVDQALGLAPMLEKAYNATHLKPESLHGSKQNHVDKTLHKKVNHFDVQIAAALFLRTAFRLHRFHIKQGPQAPLINLLDLFARRFPENGKQTKCRSSLTQLQAMLKTNWTAFTLKEGTGATILETEIESQMQHAKRESEWSKLPLVTKRDVIKAAEAQTKHQAPVTAAPPRRGSAGSLPQSLLQEGVQERLLAENGEYDWGDNEYQPLAGGDEAVKHHPAQGKKQFWKTAEEAGVDTYIEEEEEEPGSFEDEMLDEGVDEDENGRVDEAGAASNDESTTNGKEKQEVDKRNAGSANHVRAHQGDARAKGSGRTIGVGFGFSGNGPQRKALQQFFSSGAGAAPGYFHQNGNQTTTGNMSVYSDPNLVTLNPDTIEKHWLLCGTPWDDYGKSWDMCRGTWPNTRGFTCGLWLFLHSIALAEDKNDVGAKRDLNILRDGLKNFYQCEACLEHFLKIPLDDEDQSSRKFTGLWWWRAHNIANKRIGATEMQTHNGDPNFPKLQWPTVEMCPQCRKSETRWDLDKVYLFLRGFYVPDAQATKPMVAIEEQESQTETKNWEVDDDYYSLSTGHGLNPEYMDYGISRPELSRDDRQYADYARGRHVEGLDSPVLVVE